METFVAVEVEEKKMDGPHHEPAIFDGNVTYSDSKNKEKRGRPRLDPAEVKRRALEKAARKAEKAAEKERLVADELAAKKELEAYKHQLRQEAREKSAAEKAASKQAREAERARKKHDDDVARARKKDEKEEEQRRKREEENRYKQRQVELQNIVISILNRTVDPNPFSIEPHIWPAVWTDDKGDRHIIEIDHEKMNCRDVGMEHVKAGIAQFSHSIATVYKDKEFLWSDKQITACLNLWRAISIPVEKPKAWAFKGERCYCFNRIEWEPDPTVVSPHWDELMSRMEDPDTVQAFIGSIFVQESYEQQYLYIQGAGREGKGSIARFLERILGTDYIGKQRPPKDDERHAGTSFHDRRLVCFTDLRTPEFLQSAMLMGLTGGDSLQVEPKFGIEFNAAPTCKILILGNPDPVIKDTPHDLDRILYSFVRPRPADSMTLSTKEYGDLLWAEGPGIVARCIEAYHRRCPTHGPITQSDAMRERIRSFAYQGRNVLAEEEYAEFAHHTFVIVPAEDGQKLTDRCFVSTHTVNNILRSEYPAASDRKGFKRWLESKGCVDWQKAGRGRVWYGLGLKNGRIIGDGKEWAIL